MSTWFCKDCLRHNCEDKMKHPMQIARIDANTYCGLFWNPQSEPAFRDVFPIKECSEGHA